MCLNESVYIICIYYVELSCSYCAGELCPNLAKERELCGFHGMNLIITELCWLVMCQ